MKTSRTTLTLSSELLAFARQRAEEERDTLSNVVAGMMRRDIASESRIDAEAEHHGIEFLPIAERARRATLEETLRLRDEPEVW